MNLQRNAASAGAFLVIVLMTFVSTVVSTVLAVTSQNITFGLVLKTVLVLGVLAVALRGFMVWGHGGSMLRWLGLALAAYVVTPSSWTASTLFVRGAGAPAWAGWIGDGLLWMGVAWLVATKTLPDATKDDSIDRLR